MAHGLSYAVVVDVAESVEVAVDEQYRLTQAASIGRSVSIGEVGGVVQVPGVARAETGNVECFDQSIKVGLRPERGIGRHRRSVMRRTEPTSIARDQRRPVNLA